MTSKAEEQYMKLKDELSKYAGKYVAVNENGEYWIGDTIAEALSKARGEDVFVAKAGEDIVAKMTRKVMVK